MGILSSRQAPSQNADDLIPAHSYKYPPKSGAYFGSHFMMGGERFESPQPETYLFGDNADLNFLGPKPVPFPYHQPSSTEPIRTLQCLAAIRRDSIKFSKTTSTSTQQQKINPSKPAAAGNSPKSSTRNPSDTTAAESHNNNNDQSGEDQSQSQSHSQSTHIDLTSFEETQYNIEFTLDCDSPCSVTIYYFATEEVAPAEGVRYVSKRPELTSPTYYYEIGAGQSFNHTDHTFDPCLYRADELLYKDDTEVIPVVIHIVAESADNGCGPQSHSTLAIVEKSAEGHGFVLKPLKQKIYVDGVSYLLQEIYGIENKNSATTTISNNVGHSSAGSPNISSTTNGVPVEAPQPVDTSNEENGTECVVCMSELRDTLILPCRHLCLCSGCAETLRYKAMSCPICRAPFRALLQVKTLRRIRGGPGLVVTTYNADQAVAETSVSSTAASFLNRYEPVPLIEALNGPMEAPTVMLPINPIPPAASSSSTTGVGAGSRIIPPRASTSGGQGGANKRQAKRPKGKKTPRPPAAIQEVLTAQSLGGGPSSPKEPSAPPLTPPPARSDADLSLPPPPPAPTVHQLLPGQTSGDSDEDEYMEAREVVVACGEVVAKPELEGPPPTDDEHEVTFSGGGRPVAVVTGGDPIKEAPPEQQFDEPCSTTTTTTSSGNSADNNRRGGTDTPNSSNSVSSVTSTASSHPLLPPDQQQQKVAADSITQTF